VTLIRAPIRPQLGQETKRPPLLATSTLFSLTGAVQVALTCARQSTTVRMQDAQKGHPARPQAK